VVLIPFCSFAEQRTLNVDIIDFVPLYQFNEQGKAIGRLSEKVLKIIEKAGYDVRMNHVSEKRMILDIIEGKADVWMGVSAMEEFKTNALIGKESFLNMQLSAWTTGKKIVLKNPEDLKKYSVILITGYNYGGLADYVKNKANDVRYVEVNDIEQAYQILDKNRADLFLDYDMTMNSWAEKNPNERWSHEPFKNVDCHIVVSKKSINAEKVLADLEKAMLDLHRLDASIIR
jgi:polar amino acid transport system substrate-binding protein